MNEVDWRRAFQSRVRLVFNSKTVFRWTEVNTSGIDLNHVNIYSGKDCFYLRYGSSVYAVWLDGSVCKVLTRVRSAGFREKDGDMYFWVGWSRYVNARTGSLSCPGNHCRRIDGSWCMGVVAAWPGKPWLVYRFYSGNLGVLVSPEGQTIPFDGVSGPVYFFSGVPQYISFEYGGSRQFFSGPNRFVCLKGKTLCKILPDGDYETLDLPPGTEPITALTQQETTYLLVMKDRKLWILRGE